MARSTVPLSIEHLDKLCAPCRDCLFWESEQVHRRRLGAQQRAAEKAAWFAEVAREWGPPGRTLLVDGEPVGYLAYAPAAYLPGAAAFPTAPVSADAVLLTTGHLSPAGAGLGRVLVQAMARDLLQRGGVRAVEAFGRRPHSPLGTPGGADCVLPVAFLHEVGFRTRRPHPFTPRLRMDLRSAVTWRDEVHAAWRRLAGVVRPAPEAASSAALPPALPSAPATPRAVPRRAESPRT
ncbi:GNAT family N-acetyltransferase [Nocardioides sp. zg-ZUI104]|uniref:GNAT family N-acetyltransferase n=1 Tax=Nocardioides faecalis TaxID=2803858 RepID=UPI001BCF7B75|nr:GNAT family N-acetyltransferase [Nocardioides faecalis]MBS4753183.1 GNAT family N-acetyltransferase [Nocardioides faecalis]